MAKRLSLGLMVLLLNAGCIFDPYACVTQSRFLDATATLWGDDIAPGGSATVNFLQFKGGDTQRSLTWFIRADVDTARVTAVHLHRGAEGEVGEIIFEFANGYSGPGNVVTQTSPQLWTGTMDYEELFQAIRDGGVYVDVHTLDHPEGEVRGQLSVWRERGWQDSCT